MMYSEFVENTGCRETQYNYQIFCDLEKMYMADDSISKEKIYEYGKKLVDNSLTPEQKQHNADAEERIKGYKEEIAALKSQIQKQHNADVEERIKGYKEEIAALKSQIETKQWYIDFENDEFRKKHLKLDIQELKARIKEFKNQIEIAKSCLYV